MNHLIVTYSSEKAESGHVDPNFTMLVYGDSGHKGNVIKTNLDKGSYIFFNTRIGTQRYITAYYYIEKILSKAHGQASEILSLKCDAKDDEVVVIGNREKSKILTSPLLLDKNLMMKLKSFGADGTFFSNKSRTELQLISDKTLNHHILPEWEKEELIYLCLNRG